MINKIKSNKPLKPYLHNIIQDEGIEINISPKLSANDYIGIKVDDFYNGLKVSDTPKSVDFIVSVDCQCGWYVLYILEMKDVKSSAGLIIKDIQSKFTNTIEDFIKKRFADIFLDSSIKYRKIFLYVISDAYRMNGKYESYGEYKKHLEFKQKYEKRDSLKVEMSLGNKIYRVCGKICKIEYEIPPNPEIKIFT